MKRDDDVQVDSTLPFISAYPVSLRNPRNASTQGLEET